MKLVSYLSMLGLLFFSFETKAQDAPKPSSYISLKVGSLGAGFEYSHPLSSRWSARISATYLQINPKKSSTSGSIITDRNTKVTVGGIALTGDFNLSKTNPNWKFCVGAVYQVNKISETRTYTYSADDDTEALGSLSLHFTAFPVNPYAGFMYGNFRSTKRIQYSLELGTLYHGKPRVEFTGTGRISQTADQIDKVKNNVKNYNFFPVASVNIRYILR